MKKRFILALSAAVALPVMAQTAIDAYQLSRYDLRGTARFMSMGGAFGALGGDLSTLNQNPGGIGVYRKSEIGFTLDIEMQNTTSTSTLEKYKDTQTKVGVNNFGYVGSAYTGSDIMPIFNWGFSYGRVASFNRRFQGSLDMNGSLSNLIAGYTTSGRYTQKELENTYENWAFGEAPLLSLLGYNANIINSVGNTNQYNGLWDPNKTYGISDYAVEEKGYVDEYEINVGGNFDNTLFWGLGIGITDIQYTRATYYGEYLDWAKLPKLENGVPVTGEPAQLINNNGNPEDSGFDLNSFKRITGTGVNVKFGLIYKPINELRIGFAVHTPTFYSLTQEDDAQIRSYYGFYKETPDGPYLGPEIIDVESQCYPADSYDWKLRTPWRMIFSAAGVIGSNAIVSLDYEYRPYQNMSTKYGNGNNADFTNDDIKSYYNSANIIRLGAEYRITPAFSVRAGYAYESTPTTKKIRKYEIGGRSEMEVFTSPYEIGVPGLTPSYTLDNSTQYITCGLGYRYKNFYADAAYVHKSRKSEFHPYTGAIGSNPEEKPYTLNPYTAEIKENFNNIVLSVGFKF